MTCTLFKTDPEFVTPIGIWLSKKLNKGADIVWPFVTQYTYDLLMRKYGDRIRELRESYQNLEEFEEYHFGNSNPILPFPSGGMEYGYEEYDLLQSPVRRFDLNIEPLRRRYEIDHRNLRFTDSEYVKTTMIKEVGEMWRRKGEEELRRFFESLEEDDRQIRKVS